MTNEEYNTLNKEERELVDEIGMENIESSGEFVRCSRCGVLMMTDTKERYTHLGCLCDCCYDELYK